MPRDESVENRASFQYLLSGRGLTVGVAFYGIRDVD